MKFFRSVIVAGMVAGLALGAQAYPGSNVQVSTMPSPGHYTYAYSPPPQQQGYYGGGHYPQAQSPYYGAYGQAPQQRPMPPGGQPMTTYSYTPQGGYEETEIWVPVIRYEKRKAYKPVEAVMPGQMPNVQMYQGYPTGGYQAIPLQPAPQMPGNGGQ